MLGVGHKFPAFSMQATVSLEKGKAFQTITDQDYKDKWKIYFFWPKDFTFVCPTEIAAFGKLNREFADRDAQVLGGSTDSEFVHHAWRTHHDDLKDLPFPMLADVTRKLCEALGIVDPQEGVAQRATFIVDPHNIIRFVSVNDLSVGRNPLEVLRVSTHCRPMSSAYNWQRARKRSKSRSDAMELEQLLDGLPEYAKDLKLNMGGVMRQAELTEQQAGRRRGFRGCRAQFAIARKHPRRGREAPERAGNVAASRRGGDGDEQHLLPLSASEHEPEVCRHAGAPAHAGDRETRQRSGGFRALVPHRFRIEWLRFVRRLP